MLVDRFTVGLQGLGALGADSCPSVEQLQGVQDCSDPCQANNPPCSGVSSAYAAGVNSAQGGIIPSNVDLSTEAAQAQFNAGYVAGSPMQTSTPIAAGVSVPAAGVPPSLIAVGGAVAFVFLLILRKK